MITEFLAWYSTNIAQYVQVLHVVLQGIFDIFLYLAIAVSVMFYFIIIYAVLVRKKQKKYSFLPNKVPFVTIQLPTKNELAALQSAEKCLAFDYPKDKYEILIGDDSDDKKVSEQLRAFAKEHKLVSVHDRPNNDEFKAGNLKNLLKHTKGEIIVVFDSDFLPPQDFLRRIVAPFQHDKDVSVVQARWMINNSNTNMITVLGATIMKVFHYITMPFIQRFGKTGLLCGSAEAIRKKHLEEAGGWSGRCLIEDIECSMRLHIQKRKFVYLDDLECTCEVPYTQKDLYKQQKRWAYGVVKSVKTYFWLLLKSKPDLRRAVSLLVFSSGYLLSALIAGLFVFGVLAFITHEPSAFNLSQFLTETGRNVLLTSGLLVASVVAIFHDKDIRRLDKVIIASFSYGLVVMVWVNIGLYEVFSGKQLGWHVPKKTQDEKQ